MGQVVLEAEISREQVPLRNAYRHVGQKASVRVNSGIEYTVPGEDTPSFNGVAYPRHMYLEQVAVHHS